MKLVGRLAGFGLRHGEGMLSMWKARQPGKGDFEDDRAPGSHREESSRPYRPRAKSGASSLQPAGGLISDTPSKQQRPVLKAGLSFLMERALWMH